MNTPATTLLLTPGPLTTAAGVRDAMTRDWGSRDPAFVALIGETRRLVTQLAADLATHDAVLLQGSGTFGVEAALGTFVPRDGRVLVLVNGAYGRRMVQICERIGRAVESLVFTESQPVDPTSVAQRLAHNPAITHVAAVHCETTTGLLNPIEAIAEVTAAAGRELLLDSMSAFGALPVHADTVPFQALMASSNKCLEGAPGMAFVIARKDALQAAGGNCHSVALDLHDQWVRFNKDGQWRFTPPTHVCAAFHNALKAHDAQGGVDARGGRYQRNCATLVAGMRKLGFVTLLPDALQAPIIVTFMDPADPKWDFPTVYGMLVDRGFAIYPGKLTDAATFRVGCIGDLQPADIDRFLATMNDVLGRIGVTERAPATA